MGCCSNRPYFWPVMVIGSIALLLQLAAFVAPGWIMLGRDLTKYDIKMIGGAKIEEEFQLPPQDGRGPRPVAMAKRSSDVMMTERPEEPLTTQKMPEMEEFQEWFMTAVVDISHVKIRVNYGLWFSTICVHEKYLGQERIIEEKAIIEEKEEATIVERSADKDSSSESHEKDGKHKKCHCKRISTYCALMYRFLFQDWQDPEWYLSYKHFGYASLLEHRIENGLAQLFMLLGLISAAGAFRKVNGCRCAGVACVIFMLVAAFLVVVPVARFARFSHHKHEQAVPVYVHPPVSVICAGLAAILAVLASMIAAMGVMCKAVRERPGRWYQFNNELEVEKKPQLVFISEPLPEKPGMEEPEKQPIE